MSDKKKKSDLWNFLYIFFPPTWLKDPCRDSWTKEYSECCLTLPVIYMTFGPLPKNFRGSTINRLGIGHTQIFTNFGGGHPNYFLGESAHRLRSLTLTAEQVAMKQDLFLRTKEDWLQITLHFDYIIPQNMKVSLLLGLFGFSPVLPRTDILCLFCHKCWPALNFKLLKAIICIICASPCKRSMLGLRKKRAPRHVQKPLEINLLTTSTNSDMCFWTTCN